MALFDLSYWHATAETYAYFGVFDFFRPSFGKIVTLPCLWSNIMGNPIFEAQFFKTKRSKLN